MAEERRESRDSVDLVYGLARAAYRADSLFGVAVLLLFLGTLLRCARRAATTLGAILFT